MTDGESKIYHKLCDLERMLLDISADAKAVRKVMEEDRRRTAAKLRFLNSRISTLKASAEVRDNLSHQLAQFLGRAESTSAEEDAVKRKFRYERNQ